MSSFISSSGLTYLWSKIKEYISAHAGTYSKPSTGIPKTDLASAVQTSLSKADTALQSYTETDPVFAASVAADITSSDISNWNSKISGKASTLENLYDQSSRPASANLAHIANGGIQHLKATTSMTEGKPSGDGHILHFHWDSSAYDAQMFISTGNPPWMQLRSSNPTDGWSGWIHVLTSNNYNTYAPSKTGTGASGDWDINITGNAATATTLDTSRNIWGQSFNGSENISGAMSGVGNITANGDYVSTRTNSTATNVTVANSIGSVGIRATNPNRGLIDVTNTVWLVGTNGTNTWLSQGNVGIGTTTPSAKLHVSGDAKISGSLSIGGQAVAVVYSGSTAPSSSTGSDGDIYIQTTT